MASELMRSRRLEVLGVRCDGSVTGWVHPADLVGSSLGACARSFQDEQALDESIGLGEVLLALATHERVFVRWLGEYTGVITRTDLQKAPLRMWVFGAVTLLDLNMTEAIDLIHPGDAWQEYVSEGRLVKARSLWTERQRHGANCNLADCLQIKDKTDILLRDTTHLAALGFKSRREAERLGHDIESLRNHLAHAQELEPAHLKTASKLAALLPSIIHAAGVQRLFQARQQRDSGLAIAPEQIKPRQDKTKGS